MELGAAGMARTYTAVLVKDEQGRYLASVPALKGCHTWGADIGEALMMAREAIEGYLAVLQEDGGPIPEEGRLVPVEMGEAREAPFARWQRLGGGEGHRSFDGLSHIARWRPSGAGGPSGQHRTTNSRTATTAGPSDRLGGLESPPH